MDELQASVETGREVVVNESEFEDIMRVYRQSCLREPPSSALPEQMPSTLLATHQESVNAHNQDVDAHNQDVDVHNQSVNAQSQGVNAHNQSVNAHLDAHSESVNIHGFGSEDDLVCLKEYVMAKAGVRMYASWDFSRIRLAFATDSFLS